MTRLEDLDVSNAKQIGGDFGTAISLRLPEAMRAALDAWIASQPEPRLSRADAILSILAQALADVGAASIPVEDLNASNDE